MALPLSRFVETIDEPFRDKTNKLVYHESGPKKGQVVMVPTNRRTVYIGPYLKFVRDSDSPSLISSL